MISIIGSLIVYFGFALLDLYVFTIAFFVLHLTIATARFILPKKRKKKVNNLKIPIYTWFESISTISGHSARFAFIITFLAFTYSIYFSLLYFLIIPLGYERITKGYHDNIDIISGFLLGVLCYFVLANFPRIF